MTPQELRERTAAFARNIEALAAPLFNRRQTESTADQLTRSARSTASNYRAACRSRSHAEFTAKVGLVVEEADESLYWLEHIRDCDFLRSEQLTTLLAEAEELLRILGKSYATARSREKIQQSERRATRRRRSP